MTPVSAVSTLVRRHFAPSSPPDSRQPAGEGAGDPVYAQPTFHLAEEVGRFFDDSSLCPSGQQPVLVLLIGGVATGKTTLRKTQYASSHVVVDAAEVFLNLSRGAVYNYPSFLEVPMNVIGEIVARQAIAERRHIVTELTGRRPDAIRQLIDAMSALDYRVQVLGVTCDPEEAVRRNLARGVDCISAYYAEGHHLPWLLAAAISSQGANSLETTHGAEA